MDGHYESCLKDSGIKLPLFFLNKGKEQTKEKSENYLERFNVFILGNQNELSFFTFPTLTAKPRTFFFLCPTANSAGVFLALLLCSTKVDFLFLSFLAEFCHLFLFLSLN